MLLEDSACRVTHYFLTSFPFLHIFAWISVHISICRLRSFFICDHFLLKANEHFFHSSFMVPVLEKMELGGLNDSICCVHWGEVDLRVETNLHSDSWVLGSAADRHEVDSIIEDGVWGANNCAIPVSEGIIRCVVETVWNRLVTELTFFSTLKFLI